MKQKTFYELCFQEKDKPNRDAEWATSFSDAKKKAKKLLKEGATGIIIDSFRMEEGNDFSNGDVDDDSRKSYSVLSDGTLKQI